MIRTHSQQTIVLKFGGSVLADVDALAGAREEIARWRAANYRVVAVVSALAGTTDRLLANCAAFGPDHDPWAAAALTATGELQSAALLGLTLRAAEPTTGAANAGVLWPSAISLRAEGDPLDADPTTIDVESLRRALEEHDVIVLPGYVANDNAGRTILLGRGGSDLTALFVASELGARCRLVKDVDGLYEWDPAIECPDSGASEVEAVDGTSTTLPSGRRHPRRFARITWGTALTLDGQIVQHKGVRFAQDRALTFEVGGLGASQATQVGQGPDIFAETHPGQRSTAQDAAA